MSDTMPTELTAGRVVLRRTREDDAAALAEAVKDTATLAVQRERCRQARQLWRDDKEYIYVAHTGSARFRSGWSSGWTGSSIAIRARPASPGAS